MKVNLRTLGPYAPRWLRIVATYRKRKAVITPITVRDLSLIIQKRSRRTVVLVNLGTYSVLKRRSSLHGLFIPIPSIRHIYALRYAD